MTSLFLMQTALVFMGLANILNWVAMYWYKKTLVKKAEKNEVECINGTWIRLSKEETK